MRPQDDKKQDKREEEADDPEEQEVSPEELWETEGGSINPIPDAIQRTPGHTDPTPNVRKQKR